MPRRFIQRNMAAGVSKGKRGRPGQPLSMASTSWQVGVRGSSGFPGDVQPGVNVRRAPEIPDERRALEPPDVPDAVVADVSFLGVRQAHFVGTARRLDTFANLGGVASPE